MTRWQDVAMVVPSQTDRGLAWLANFTGEDRAVARALIDGMRIASADEVRGGLQGILQPALFDLPAVLVPVRAMSDVLAVIDSAESAGPDELVAYRDFSPGAPIEATPGSEAFIGTLIRDLTGAGYVEANDWIHPSAELGVLRRRRCRSIVFVTDYAGSGAQVERFVRAFLRHPTIRSWRSFGWVRTVVVAYAMARPAERVIAKVADEIRFSEAARSFATAGWNDDQRRRIEAFCRSQTPRRHRSQALGYAESAGLFLSTVSSVPNNIPFVLRRTGPGWNALFDGRIFPLDMVDQAGYRPVRGLADVAWAAGHKRLAAAMRAGRHSGVGMQLLTVLALRYERPTASVADLVHETGMRPDQTRRIQDYLRDQGLLNADMRVTPRGARELGVSRRLQRGVPAVIPAEPPTPYYPQQLR